MKTMELFDEVKKSNSTPVKHFETGDVTCPVIGLCGGDYSGKTTIAISPVCELAAPILQRSVEGSRPIHTLKDRLYVYTGKNTDRMEVRVKLKDRESLIDSLCNLVLDGVCFVVYREGIRKVAEWHCGYNNISPYLSEQHEWIFRFLRKTRNKFNIDPHIAQQVIQEYGDDEDLFLSHFIPLVRDELRKYIEDDVEHIYSQFCDVFGSCAFGDMIIVDIDLNNPDMKKVDFLFYCDFYDRSGFEIICDLVTVYVPMSEQVKGYISNNPVYRDADGEVSFAFLDTSGVFHNPTRGEVSAYVSSLNGKYDAIAIVSQIGSSWLVQSLIKGFLESFAGHGKKSGSDGRDLPIFFLSGCMDCNIKIGYLISNNLFTTEHAEKYVKELSDDIRFASSLNISADSFPCFVYYADRFCKETSVFGQGKTKYAFSNVIKDFLASVAERIKR